MSPAVFHSLLCSAVLLTAGTSSGSDPYAGKPALAQEWSGGETTVFDRSGEAFGFPAPNLTPEHRTEFFVGNSFFNENWVAAPASTTGRDGLGPLFNTRSCSSCHFKDGRSQPPAPGDPMTTMLMRLSIPGTGPHGEPLPEPTYGGQIQGRSLPGVRSEADVYVDYEEIRGEFADGEAFTLLKPIYSVRNLGYGPLAPGTRLSPRVAPALIGMGLLEAVPERTLQRLAKLQKRDRQGIAGRINYVWDSQSARMVPGRFGWKAEQPSVLHQTAAAFAGDMGLTSSMVPRENHTARQHIDLPSGGQPEVSDRILQAVATYSRVLAVPARRNWTDPMVQRGQTLFHLANCASCHVPELQTGDWEEFPELARQTIRPYTDLLLHDMGEGLSDGRPVHKAGSRDWRTPPLWGIGLIERVNGHTRFLHDGRARDLSEAILWHGGEALPARESYREFSKHDRAALLAFLQSL